MTTIWYNVGKTRVCNGSTDLDTSDLRMALIITSKTGAADPDLGTMAAIDAVGTVALHTDRQALASLTVTQDNANDRANMGAANVTFGAAAGVTALAYVIYDHAAGGTDASRFPLVYDDTNFGAGIPMDGGLVVQLTNGWARAT